MRLREDLNTRVLLETAAILRRGLARRVVEMFAVVLDAFGTGIRELGAPGDALRTAFRVDGMMTEGVDEVREGKFPRNGWRSDEQRPKVIRLVNSVSVLSRMKQRKEEWKLEGGEGASTIPYHSIRRGKGWCDTGMVVRLPRRVLINSRELVDKNKEVVPAACIVEWNELENPSFNISKPRMEAMEHFNENVSPHTFVSSVGLNSSRFSTDI